MAIETANLVDSPVRRRSGPGADPPRSLAKLVRSVAEAWQKRGAVTMLERYVAKLLLLATPLLRVDSIITRRSSLVADLHRHPGIPWTTRA
eukprot:scaffold114103_cov29-Tisochrysis_lutea.AAC.7